MRISAVKKNDTELKEFLDCAERPGRERLKKQEKDMRSLMKQGLRRARMRMRQKHSLPFARRRNEVKRKWIKRETF